MERLDALLDGPFGATNNPLKNLGALGWMFYWVVVASGLYLFVFFDTGIVEAYESVEYMTVDQWYAAGVMRSLHRYASDAMIVVMLVHIGRELLAGQYRGARWFTWVSGVPLVVFLYASGITGYWLVWDQLAQYVAVSTTEWLDAFGIFGEPLARNFFNSAVLSSRFFSLMVFLHIAVPLILLLLMWLHIQRVSRPGITPPRGLAVGCLVAMLVLALAFPAVSQGPADLDRVVAVVGIDWFFLTPYPLLDTLGPGTLWLLVGGSLGLLLLVPLVPWRRPRLRPAEMDLENCNGCARCAADCPFDAITMIARTDGKPYMQEASVDADLCTRCGLCVGACPTATPFRVGSALAAGIELPDARLAELRARGLEALERLSSRPRIVVFGCAAGPDARLLGDRAALLEVPCMGALPPSFIDFFLSRGRADGVLLAGCREGACFYRHGVAYTSARIRRERDPYLRARVPRERLRECWVGAAGYGRLEKALADFSERISTPEESTQEPGTVDEGSVS